LSPATPGIAPAQRVNKSAGDARCCRRQRVIYVREGLVTIRANGLTCTLTENAPGVVLRCE